VDVSYPQRVSSYGELSGGLNFGGARGFYTGLSAACESFTHLRNVKFLLLLPRGRVGIVGCGGVHRIVRFIVVPQKDGRFAGDASEVRHGVEGR